MSSSVSDTVYFDVMPYAFARLPAKVIMTYTIAADGAVEIELTTDNYARVVEIEGPLVLEDNYFDMLPSDVKTVRGYLLPGSEDTAIGLNWMNV